jgi:hypothetical protein
MNVIICCIGLSHDLPILSFHIKIPTNAKPFTSISCMLWLMLQSIHYDATSHMPQSHSFVHPSVHPYHLCYVMCVQSVMSTLSFHCKIVYHLAPSTSTHLISHKKSFNQRTHSLSIFSSNHHVLMHEMVVCKHRFLPCVVAQWFELCSLVVLQSLSLLHVNHPGNQNTPIEIPYHVS